MDNHNMPKGFSGFTWGIAFFCVPILLYPMALLLSPVFDKNPSLSNWENTFFTIFFWIYPFALGVIARILFKLHKVREKLAVKLLLLAILSFYLLLAWAIIKGFMI